MSDERYDRSADMRLLDLHRQALGMPARPMRSTTYTDPDPLADVAQDEDDEFVQSGTVLIASIDAWPRTPLIPGALVTVSLSVANDGDMPGSGARMFLALPIDTAYQPGTLTIDGAPAGDDAANDLFGNGADLGSIEPASRRTLSFKLLVEAGAEDIILAPHLSAAAGAVLGLRAMRLTRRAVSPQRLFVERPFYESDETEDASDELTAEPPASLPTLAPRAVSTPVPRMTAQARESVAETVAKPSLESLAQVARSISPPVPKREPEQVAQSIPRSVPTREPEPVAQSSPPPVTKREPLTIPQSIPAPVSRREPEPVEQSIPAPVPKREPEPVAQSIPAPVPKREPEPVAQSVTAPVPSRPKETLTRLVRERVMKQAPQPVAPDVTERPAPVRKRLPVAVVKAVTEPVKRHPTSQPAAVRIAKSATDSVSKRMTELVAKTVAEALEKRATQASTALPAAGGTKRVTRSAAKSAAPVRPKSTVKSMAQSVAEVVTKKAAPPKPKSAPKLAAKRVLESKPKPKLPDKPRKAKSPSQAVSAPTADTQRIARPKIEVVRSVDDRISFTGQGGPMLAVRIDRKRLNTLTGLFSGASLGMIAHYLVLNALAARDPLPGDGTDGAIAAFVGNQEQLLSRALITMRLGKTPTPESVGAELPPFPPKLATHTDRRVIDAPPPGQAMLFRAFQPAEVLFVKRMLSNETAAPFMRAAQLFVGLCANDAVVADEHERRRLGVALTAYAALATAEISRIFLRAKLSGLPDLFKSTDTDFDNAARTVLAAIAQSIV